jgi:hypothetical protein
MAAVGRKTEHVKILQDLGYDPWEIENDDDMLSALKASINDLSRENPGDGRIPMLQDAVKGLRRSKFAAKKTTVTGKNINKAKLLPGTTFSSQDISPNEAEMVEDGGKKGDVIAFLNGDVTDKLEEINQSVVEIKDVIITQGDLADDRDEEMRKAILADKKKKREKKLEKKKGIKEKMLDTVTKPVGNFLNKLIKFVMMTFVGSVINRVLTLLKDPAQFLDPIKRFFNFVIGLVNSVMKGLWMITGAPMNFIIGGINKGVSTLLDALNKATGLLKIPPVKAPEIPLVPGPPEFQFIPLSKTAQAKNEAVGMSEGGLVPGDQGEDGIDGVDGESGIDGVDGMEFIGKDGVDGREFIGKDGVDGMQSMGTAGKDGADGMTPKTKGFSGGGIVPAPYPVHNVLGTGHNVLNIAPNNIMGYNKGGKVPGSGNKDTVPAMLTPGEFVMSKGAVDQIGVDNLKEMNAAGGGTNQPKLMKFAGGGSVPEIGTPPSRGRNVVVLGGGGKKSSKVSVSGGAGQQALRFSSTDPNNVTTPVVKSLYNMMG